MKKSPLEDIRTHSSQVFYTNKFQLFDFILAVVNQIGSCCVRISTFSNSEEFLRRLYLLRTKGKLTKLQLISDRRALLKTMRLSTLMKNVYDDVYVASNHGKMVLLENCNFKVSILTSQNQTRGSRYEIHTITTDGLTYQILDNSWNKIIDGATKIDNILSRHLEQD